jgi:hypothetical protein
MTWRDGALGATARGGPTGAVRTCTAGLPAGTPSSAARSGALAADGGAACGARSSGRDLGASASREGN